MYSSSWISHIVSIVHLRVNCIYIAPISVYNLTVIRYTDYAVSPCWILRANLYETMSTQTVRVAKCFQIFLKYKSWATHWLTQCDPVSRSKKWREWPVTRFQVWYFCVWVLSSVKFISSSYTLSCCRICSSMYVRLFFILPHTQLSSYTCYIHAWCQLWKICVYGQLNRLGILCFHNSRPIA